MAARRVRFSDAALAVLSLIFAMVVIMCQVGGNNAKETDSCHPADQPDWLLPELRSLSACSHLAVIRPADSKVTLICKIGTPPVPVHGSLFWLRTRMHSGAPVPSSDLPQQVRRAQRGMECSCCNSVHYALVAPQKSARCRHSGSKPTGDLLRTGAANYNRIVGLRVTSHHGPWSR